MIRPIFQYLAIAFIFSLPLHEAAAQSAPEKMGIVIMHGKGGSPARLVSEQASALEEKGYLVANLEMPWSGRREYDASVEDAEREVEAALGQLRARGAAKLFVAGHSQGGLFALHFGGRHTVSGIIAIAPGGNANSLVFRENLGDTVQQARKLIAEGKGNEKARFIDFESSRGSFPVLTTPANYLGWFDPDGAMNQMTAEKKINPQIPVLFIAPRGDYPGLLKIKQQMFNALPKNPLTRLYEPDASHVAAPSAARDEIVRWTMEVAAGR